MPLFPAILPVPSPPSSISGREKVKWIRDTSREALRLSAHLSGVRLQKLEKDDKGAPVPFSGIYWSVSHKPLFAAAVLGKYPIGIDIEEIKPRSNAVIKKIISEKESIFFIKKNKLNSFFRIWTAKEAVLKAEGIGLAGLGKCRLTEVPDESTMHLKYEQKIYCVNQIYLKKHVVSVTTNGEPVNWIFPSSL